MLRAYTTYQTSRFELTIYHRPTRCAHLYSALGDNVITLGHAAYLLRHWRKNKELEYKGAGFAG
jgi:hypothetical protein